MIHQRSTSSLAPQAQTRSIDALQGLADLILSETGLSFERHKFAMLQSRLAPRMRTLGVSSLEAYLELLKSPSGACEKNELVSALTTNVSSFFREPHHFDLLAKDIGPTLLAKQNAGERIRIWSAGCSNGQEPLSIAMKLFENDLIAPTSDVKILATDIDKKVLRFAAEAKYPERMIEGISDKQRVTYFDQVGKGPDHCWQPKEKLTRMISYRKLNLLSAWPMSGKFDVIFCRNVVIYFEQAAQEYLWQRFSDALTPTGHLILGHSERLAGPATQDLQAVGTTVYTQSVATFE